MEQYEGDDADLESLPTMIIKIALRQPILYRPKEKRQLIRIIIVFNYSGVSLLGRHLTAFSYFAGFNNWRWKWRIILSVIHTFKLNTEKKLTSEY